MRFRRTLVAALVGSAVLFGSFFLTLLVLEQIDPHDDTDASYLFFAGPANSFRSLTPVTPETRIELKPDGLVADSVVASGSYELSTRQISLEKTPFGKPYRLDFEIQSISGAAGIGVLDSRRNVWIKTQSLTRAQAAGFIVFDTNASYIEIIIYKEGSERSVSEVRKLSLIQLSS